MPHDVFVSLAGYATVYVIGGIVGFGAAALCAMVGKSDLVAENARLRRLMADRGEKAVVPFDGRVGDAARKTRLRLIGEG